MSNILFKNPVEYQRFRWYKTYTPSICCFCGKTFSKNDTISYGLRENNEYGCSCSMCQNRFITQICNELYDIKHFNKIPSPQTILWKYLDLAKFISLLSSRELYFTRLDHFSDKYEGALCSRDGLLKFNTDDYKIRRCIAIANLKSDGIEEPTESEIEERYNKLRSQFDKNRILNRERTFVNCWCANEVESEAMWRLYSKDMKCGIAIQTTYERLFKSLDPYSNVDIQSVQYINYDHNFYAYSNPEWYKRKSLEYENEVRAVVRNTTNHIIEYNKLVDVDLDNLIIKVVTSPEAELWFTDLVREICRKYNCFVEVKKSNIQIPIYY